MHSTDVNCCGRKPRPTARHKARIGVTLLSLAFLMARSWMCCAAVHERRRAERESGATRWEGKGGENEPPVGGGIRE